MKVEIKPLDIKKWHGKKGKESFQRPIKLHALVDADTNQYATGLDYVNKTFKHPDKEGEMMTEAEYYGHILGQDLSPIFNLEKPHPFWDGTTPVIKLENNTTILKTEKPLDYIKYKIAKASRFIANSYKEWEEGLFPDATHYIFDEKEEAEVKASKVSLKNNAIIEASKLSLGRKIQIVMVLSEKNLKNQSENFVLVELDKLIEAKPQEVLRLIRLDEEDLTLHAMVLEALQKNILRKVGHKIMYFDSVLGEEPVDVVEYLKANENQDFKLKLMSQLN